MAKTTGPNLLGIHKEMLEAGKDTRAESLVGGAAQAFAVNIAEQEKAEAEMEKHMENLGGIENIGKISEQQRGPVTEFLRANRDEYAELAKQYAKSKDPAIKDKMDAIKYKFENLNTQLSTFATNKGEYMLDYEEGNLMKGGSFAKDNAFYTSVYGNPNAQFTIDGDGAMSFTVNGETRKLEDFGEHTLRNYDGEKNIDALFGLAATLKEGGKDMSKDRFATNFVNGHKGISKNDLSALLQTDLTGDDSDLSFMDQWASGTMGDEFYAEFTKDETAGKYIITKDHITDLLNDKQRGLDLMGKFVGNVSQGIYDEADVSSDILQTRQYKQAQIDAMNRKNKGGNGGGGGGFEGWGSSGWRAPDTGQWVVPKTATLRRTSLDAFKSFIGSDNEKWDWNTDEDNPNMWVAESTGKTKSHYDLAYGEGLIKSGEAEATFNVGYAQEEATTSAEEAKIQKQKLEGKATIDMINVKDQNDDVSADNLNNWFKRGFKDFNKFYQFVPYTTQRNQDGTYPTQMLNLPSGMGKGKMLDRVNTNDLMLIDMKTKMPVGKKELEASGKFTWDGKGPWRITTRGDADQKQIDVINKFLSEYVAGPKPPSK